MPEALEQPSLSPGADVMAGAEGLMPELPKPASPEDAAKLKPGSEFLDPEGKKRTVPYKPASIEEVETEVPEGADFLDPAGKLRVKPKYEGVGFTAQALHDMALTDQGKEKALKTIYGDKVKRSPTGSLYVEDDGVFRKPDGRGITGGLGHVASEVAPLGGMTAGMLAGGAGGTLLEPGGGTAIGGFGGMVLGAMAGRQVNNAALAIAGIHEDMGDQLQSMATEGAAAAGGEVLGKGISKIPGIVSGAKRVAEETGQKAKGIVTGLSDILESIGITPKRARDFLGMTPERAEQAASITNRGGKVSPSAAFPEAPGLKKIEEFDAVFRAQNVFGEAARDFYEQEARKVAESPEIGASIDQLLTQAEKKVSSEKAGQMTIEAARRDMAHDDAALEAAVRDAKMASMARIDEMGGPEAVKKLHADKMEALNAAHKATDSSARNLIDQQIKELQGDIDKSLEMTKKGEDPSALLRMTEAKFRLYNAATRARAKTMYNAADEAAGGALPDTQPLAEDADAFLKTLPETLRAKYPVEIRDLAKLAGDAEKDVPPQALTFGQLHHLRSWFRHGIDYDDLTPDMREGSLKYFEKKINSVLHAKDAAPELKQASELLDRADAFYKDKIPFLNDQMVKGTIKSLQSGAGINPEALAKILFDPERTEAMRKTRSIVGENLWNSVQAAHLQDMLGKSRMVDGQINAKKFAEQVHADIKNGLIESAYDKQTAARVAKIAEDVAKLDGSLPVTANEGDTISTLMRKMAATKEQAEKLAESDPFVALQKEMANLDKQLNLSQKALQKARKVEPLNFLNENNLSHMAVRAANKILGSQDLIMAASTKFGPESPEFNALRQVYVTRFFQRALGKTATMRPELGGEKGMTEEVQALMFPGVTRGQMVQVTRDMEFLFSGGGADMGGSLAAASRVLNPWQHIPLPKLEGLGGFLMAIPGSTAAARFALGKVFATTMDAVSHPNFINWLAGNLKGGESQRELARFVLHQRMALGGWFGAAAAQMAKNGEQRAPDGNTYRFNPKTQKYEMRVR